MLRAALHLPAITVSSIGIDSKLNQELDDLGVSSTDGVMQCGDALVIRRARIFHLHQRPPLMKIQPFSCLDQMQLRQLSRSLDNCLQNYSTASLE